MPEGTAAPPEIRNSFVEANGIRLHCASAGSGKLVLFLHGFPEFWYAWRKQLLDFGRDHLAVAPDLRGYNLSSKPPEVDAYALPLLVEDVRALAEHFTGERFVLVGHDWGGVLAWAFAMLHPEKLEKLIVINAPHPAVFDRELRENPAQQEASRYMHFNRSPQAEPTLSAGNFALFDSMFLQYGMREGFFSEDDRQAYLAAWSQPGALTGGLNYYRAARVGPPGAAGERAAPLAALFPSLTVRVPTLVIWGEKDPYLLMGNLKGLDRFVPNLQVRLLADGTHWVVHEMSGLVNNYMRAFVKASRTAPGQPT